METWQLRPMHWIRVRNFITRSFACKSWSRNGLSFICEYDGFNGDARCIHTWGDGGIYDHKITYLEGLTIVENSLGHRTSYFHKGGLLHKTINALEWRVFRIQFIQWFDCGNRRGRKYRFLHLRWAQQSNTDYWLLMEDKRAFSLTEMYLSLPWMHPKGTWIWTQWTKPSHPATQSWRHYYPIYTKDGLLSTITDYKGNKTGFSMISNTMFPELVLSDRDTINLGIWRTWKKQGIHWWLGKSYTVRKFDARGRVTGINEPDGNIRSLEYDRRRKCTFGERQIAWSEICIYWNESPGIMREENKTKVEFKYDTEDQLTVFWMKKSHI